jgi:hypothetical protein
MPDVMRHARVRLALLVPVLLGLAVPGCRSRVAGPERGWYAGGAFSAIPGVGLAAGGGKVLGGAGTYDWAAEAQIVRHFLDDKDLADDENADHGRMTAVRAGFKHTFAPGSKRHLTVRYGFQFYRATGVPGIVEDPGDYYGFYAGVGFETDLDEHWTMGPEISLAVMEGEGPLQTEVVPTFFWHLLRNF